MTGQHLVLLLWTVWLVVALVSVGGRPGAVLLLVVGGLGLGLVLTGLVSWRAYLIAALAVHVLAAASRAFAQLTAVQPSAPARDRPPLAMTAAVQPGPHAPAASGPAQVAGRAAGVRAALAAAGARGFGVARRGDLAADPAPDRPLAVPRRHPDHDRHGRTARGGGIRVLAVLQAPGPPPHGDDETAAGGTAAAPATTTRGTTSEANGWRNVSSWRNPRCRSGADELSQAQADFRRAQDGLRHAQDRLSHAQEELRHMQAELRQAQDELRRSHTDLHQAHSDLRPANSDLRADAGPGSPRHQTGLPRRQASLPGPRTHRAAAGR